MAAFRLATDPPSAGLTSYIELLEPTRLRVGVGKDSTSTRTGLGYISVIGTDPALGDVIVTNVQSEALDGYDGAPYAAFALHPDPEGGAAVGKARSNGCIRMDASEFRAHVVNLPVGTPVWVQP